MQQFFFLYFFFQSRKHYQDYFIIRVQRKYLFSTTQNLHLKSCLFTTQTVRKIGIFFINKDPINKDIWKENNFSSLVDSY